MADLNGASNNTQDLRSLCAEALALPALQLERTELTEALPGAVFQVVGDRSFKLRYTYVSSRSQELLGLPRQTILDDALAPSRLVMEEDSSKLFKAYQHSSHDLKPFYVDVRIRRPDGEQRWVRTFATPRADGELFCWTGYWSDVTDEVHARQRLEAAERHLHDIAESLPGVVYRMVFEGRNPTRFSHMTGGALALYGVSREDIMQDPEIISRMFDPDDRVRIRDSFIEASRSMSPLNYDFRIQRPDGQTRWLRTYSAPQLTPEGAAWVGYTTDVSAEHEAKARADDALQQLTAARDTAQAAEQRLRAIFDYTRIGLVMIDQDLKFSNANPSLRELLMIEDEEEFARDFPAFSPALQPDGRASMEKAEAVIRTAFEQGYNRFDWMHQTRAGEPRPCEIALTRVELGGQPHIFATMSDLRERVRNEAALKAASAQAQAASQAKTDFLANMSHEIRTPMNAIVGLTHLGLTSRDPERLRDYLTKIDASAKSLLQIINDILDFSKIEAGKLVLEATPFDLYGVLDNLSDMLNMRAAEQGLELLFAVEPGLASQLVGDPLRLGQVLLNLTGNAIKFTQAGQIVVSVKTVKRGRDFVRLRFEVTDTGIGLSKDEISRLFESFSQADSSTTRRYGGTGLGLAISRRLVDLMDGEISVDSLPGRGSTFSFTARFGLAPAAAARPQTPVALRGMRVLVVDDNATSVSILQAYLESFGFKVTTASSGARAIEAMQAAGAESYPLVLMDWQMPGMNGIEAARRLRALASARPSVIIMVTAFGREEVERQALTAGLDGFLIKPVNPSVLLDTILDAFGSSAALAPTTVSMPVDVASQLAGRRVLLVEDNQINQEVARELLQRAGVVVELAVNGREAVERAAAADYDALLMDVQMPVMDGMEATRRIRALAGSRASVPIIAMTANAMSEDRQRCLDAGMNDHLGKPVDVQRLHAVLAKWMRGAGRDRGPGDATATSAGEQVLAFDFEAAIKRMADSRSLWEKLVRRYLDTRSAVTEIGQQLAGDQRELASRSAHTLRGLAATLGLLALERAALALELGLKDSSGDLTAELSSLSEADEAARRMLTQQLSAAGPRQ